MLRGEFESAGEMSAESLREAYDEVLGETVRRCGIDAVAEQSGVEPDRLRALADGGSPELSLEEAAAILAADPDRPDADALLAEARDLLLMGMSTAVLDVEAIASGIDDEMEPKEIQQKVEGRFPMSLDEYAVLHSFIEGRKP